MTRPLTIILLSLLATSLARGETPFTFNDPNPKQYKLKARASEIDSRVVAHPEIGFFIDSPKGKPADIQDAAVDTRVAPKGELVIWMMGANQELFDRLNSYGLHVIRPHYANKWFSICCKSKPVGEQCRGNIRLEAATGEDFSDEVAIPKPDGMMERALQLVKWLDQENPQGKWNHFLTEDRSQLRWDKVIMSGASHGSTTSARFAKHQKVARVVALCGPRDQYQTWQSLPSATPANRFFGFSHTRDMGWEADHYCRSWELLGLHQFGPIVDVDQTASPFKNTRRLITSFDVGEGKPGADRAHGAVQPGKRAAKSDSGTYLHESVWKYLYTHPVDQVGDATPVDDGCLKVHP